MNKAKELTLLCLLLMQFWSSEATPLDAGVNSSSTEVVNQHRVKRFLTGFLSANIIAGASMAGTTSTGIALSLKNRGFTVAVVIVIENHTKWKLINGQSWTRWGHVSTAPVEIEPGQKEAWQAHKTMGTVVGSAGIIYYHVKGLDEVIGIVWHAPYNFNHLSNYLAIGMFSDDRFNSNRYFSSGYHTMRNGSPSGTLSSSWPSWPWCAREYYYNTRFCRTVSPYIEVQGTMGTSHHPTINIKIKARHSLNVAPSNRK